MNAPAVPMNPEDFPGGVVLTACSYCRRCTVLEEAGSEDGDFFVRCRHCGRLLKPDLGASRPPEAGRIQRGALTGLLISPSGGDEPADGAMEGERIGRASGKGILLAESRREIGRARARSKALARARLRASYQSLGAMAMLGCILIAFVGLSAVALKGQADWAVWPAAETTARSQEPGKPPQARSAPGQAQHAE